MGRRLAAILATDMVGYSRLMAADEADTIERQMTYHVESTPYPEGKIWHGGAFKCRRCRASEEPTDDRPAGPLLSDQHH